MVEQGMIQKLEIATPERQRWVLQSLDTRLTVKKEVDVMEISIGAPAHIMSATGDFSVQNSL